MLPQWWSLVLQSFRGQRSIFLLVFSEAEPDVRVDGGVFVMQQQYWLLLLLVVVVVATPLCNINPSPQTEP